VVLPRPLIIAGSAVPARGAVGRLASAPHFAHIVTSDVGSQLSEETLSQIAMSFKNQRLIPRVSIAFDQSFLFEVELGRS
ncbi:MAG: hypothetical protein ACREA0_10200, partial [bacterium]